MPKVEAHILPYNYFPHRKRTVAKAEWMLSCSIPSAITTGQVMVILLFAVMTVMT